MGNEIGTRTGPVRFKYRSLFLSFLSSAHASLSLFHITRSRKLRSLKILNSLTNWRRRGFLQRTAASRVFKPEALYLSGCLRDDMYYRSSSLYFIPFQLLRQSFFLPSHVTQIFVFTLSLSPQGPISGFLASASNENICCALQRVLGPKIYKLTLLLEILPSSFTSSIRLRVIMSRNPLRRLSVALRLSEAYPPTQIPLTPTSRSSVSAFLANVKDNYLKDIKEDSKKGAEWTVVMGNEAGGNDRPSLAPFFLILFSYIRP